MIKKGQLLNTNADTIASELAMPIGSFEVSLNYCFENRAYYLMPRMIHQYSKNEPRLYAKR
jgi:acetylglutamate kinase